MLGMRQTSCCWRRAFVLIAGARTRRPMSSRSRRPRSRTASGLPTKMAGNNKSNPNCVGENVSPQLSWSNPPAGTKSYVLLMSDPEGRAPAGVSHWVAYGIPASVTGFAEGETSASRPTNTSAARAR